MSFSELERRLLLGTPAEREAEAKRQGVFECWETKARRDHEPATKKDKHDHRNHWG